MPGDDVALQLEARLGRLHARQRLGMESDHEELILRRRSRRLRISKHKTFETAIRTILKLSGLYRRGQRHAENIQVRHHQIQMRALPAAFDGFTLLHLSDLHVDISPRVMRRLADLLPGLAYDLCVITGDFRGRTYGPHGPTLEGVARIRPHLHDPIYGVLGNHDTVRLVPGLEAFGVRMLMNEAVVISRGEAHLHLAGIDDAHHFRLDNIEKSIAGVPAGAFSILLSHTPEVYRQAAHAGFDLMLSGHTHGGQICLPGSIPLTLSATLPRRFGGGPWQYRGMAGYTTFGVGTAVIPVRLNCPPEVALLQLCRT